MPDVLTVKRTQRLTPNMIRVTLTGDSLQSFPTGREGGNCKIFVPEPNQSEQEFAERLDRGDRITKRTYTVRAFRADSMELDIDFVAHGETGPASSWAINAKPGSYCGFRGASSPKVENFYADWYLLAADMSALPVASATLEAMPRDAKGVAVFEVHSEADKQDIDAPAGIDIRWLIVPDIHRVSMQQLEIIKSLDWPSGRVQTCIAGESNAIRAIKQHLYEDRKIDKQDAYISGYWKVGLIEDEHQLVKRQENA